MGFHPGPPLAPLQNSGEVNTHFRNCQDSRPAIKSTSSTKYHFEYQRRFHCLGQEAVCPPILLPPSLLKTSEPYVGAGAEAHADTPLPPPSCPGRLGVSQCHFSATRLPKWCSGKESACQCRRLKFNPWVRKIPWRRKWQPTPVFLPGESHEQRSLAGYSSWGHKTWT